MKKSFVRKCAILATSVFFSTCVHAADDVSGQLNNIVDGAIQPVMKEFSLPGMAVALTVQGKRYFFNYGVASKESGRKVTEKTLFEIGSVSKTFTATLVSYAGALGALSLSDSASKYLPALSGSSFDRISLLDLGTYTAGGLPLQFPDTVIDQEEMIAYYRNWRPAYPAGTHRVYSNPSIGLFGYLAAKSMGEPFDALMEEKLFPAFGLTDTYIHVPQDWMEDYAYGYSRSGKPIRVTDGVLDSEAYGVKTTSADLIHFVEANIDSSILDETWRRAIATTHTGYYRIGDMTQGLGWEMYAYPTNLDLLLAGNSTEMARNANKATKLAPPMSSQGKMLFNKTGSTNGFGAYVAFIPARGIGIVMLANKAYPNPERVKAAYRILTALDSQPGLTDSR